MRIFLKWSIGCLAIATLVTLSAQAMAQTAQTKAPPSPRPALAPKAMTNADVVKMVQGGLGDDLIVTAIRKTSRTAFDLTADGLLQLKGSGVSNAILRVMLDPTAKPEIPPPAVPAPAPPVAKAEPQPPTPASSTSPVEASESASGRQARHENVVEQSAKQSSVSGGATFTVAKAYDRTYDAVLNYLKQKDQTIDSASRDTGQIITALSISGGYSQTGRRVQTTLIRNSSTSTTVKVAIVLQHRKKLLQTEPWSDPKVDAKQSDLAAKELKAALDATN
jgi:hypothetical protein